MASRDEVVRFVYQVTGDEKIAAATRAMLDAGKGGDAATDGVKHLTDELARLADQSNAIKRFTESKAALKETSDNLEEAKAGLAALNKEFDSTDKSSRAVSKAFAAAEKAVADLTAEQRRQEVEFAKAQGALQKAGVDTTKLAEANTKLEADAAAAAASIGKVSAQAGKASTDTSYLASAATKVRDSFASVTVGVGEFLKTAAKISGITGLVTGLVSAVTGFKVFSAGADEAAKFDAALGKLRLATSGSAEQFEALKLRVRETASAFDITASDGAAAAGKLASAFGNADKAIAALPATIQLAKAAQIEFGAAADALSASIKAFGGSADEAMHYADALATVATKTGQELGGLSGTMAQLAPFAAEIGVSFDDLAALLGALASKGIDSERALGGLRGLFEALRDPTSTLRQELVGLGIDTSSLSSIITGLASAGPRAEAALGTLGTKGKAAILALVNDGGAALRQFQGDLANTEGAAAKAANAVEDNLLDAFVEFGASIKNVVGDVISGALDPIKEEVRSLTARFKDLPQSAGFAAIKQAITDFATNGIAAIESLIVSINFDAASKHVADFVNGATGKFGDLGASVREWGSNASTIANSVGLVFRALQSTIFGLAAAGASLAEFAGKAALVATGQISILKDESNAFTRALTALGSSAETNWQRAIAAGSKAADNFDGITGALDNTGKAFAGVKAGADSTAPALGRVAEGADKAGAAANGVADGLQKLASAGKQTARDLAIDKYVEAAAALDRLKQSSTTTAEQLDAAQRALFSARRELQQFGPDAQRTAAATDGLKAAFAKLGVESQESLERAAAAAKNAFDAIDKGSAQTAAGLADRRAAFLSYAQAAIAAAHNMDEGTRLQVMAQLEAKAAALGLSDELRKLGGAGEDSGRRTAQSFGQVRQVLSDTAGQAAANNQRMQEMQQQISGGLSPALDALAANMSRFGQTSEAAALEYNRLVRALFEGAGAFSAQAIADSTGIIRFGEAVQQAARLTEDALSRQRESMAALVDSYQTLSDSQIEAMARGRGGVDRLTESLRAQAQAAREGRSEFNLLGVADLGPLAAALDAAAAKVDELRQRTLAAKQAFEDYAASARDQIDQINGDLDAAEDRRFKRELERLRKQAEEAGALNSAEYNDAVAAANELHRLKMQQIKEQAAARRKVEEEAAAARSGEGGKPSRGDGGSKGGPSGRGDGAGIPSGRGDGYSTPSGRGDQPSINVNVQGSVIGGTPAQLAEQFARMVKPELDRIARASR
jgi:TP901 family phage tail tape measure protein